ncbi:MAG: EAL domain-containing protein, partial [Lachnospiraceae bacterium]|nr:EAL domain-containing protein [Lachnospiraceae bacterium]
MARYVFEAQVQAAFEGLQNPLAIYQFIDKRVVTLVLSDGFLELLGYDSRQKACHDMDQNMYRDVHPDDVARVAGEAYRFATEGGIYDIIYRSYVKDRSAYRVVHAVGRHIYMEDGTRLAQVCYTDEGMYSEDAERAEPGVLRAMNVALRAQSGAMANIYDAMTGLPGMSYFFELAEAGRAALLKAGKQPVLLFLDLSGMKFYNRKYGFAEGDKLIRSFATLLADTFGNESCCHIGGDHFAFFSDGEEIKKDLNRLFDTWKDMQGERALPVRAGIFEDGTEVVSAYTACDRAKFACDAIRNNYTSGFSYYDSHLRDEQEMRQYIITNIDRAIDEHWIQVYYQPIVRAVNGKVCDEEALARWIDPERGFLSPGDFIPSLEEAGLIYKLDLYVLEQVLEKIRVIQESGYYIVPQSINLSRSDFDACDIIEEIVRRVDAAGVRHDLITIEITESIIGGDFDFIKQKIERFRELGFPVWMDDFGSGYSSLDVLQSVTFDLIKFDMSFMKRLDEGDAGKIVLTDLMRMATALGVDTVCEGVETEEQLHFLQMIGCSKLQGFYFLKPIPLDQILYRYENGIQIGFENPDETGYYNTMGKINLYDLSFMMSGRDNTFRNVFDTIPLAIIEVNATGDMLRYIRSNNSFRAFMRRSFDLDLSV